MHKAILMMLLAVVSSSAMAKMKTLCYDSLTVAQKNKEIRADVDCDCLANYLCNYTYGFVNHGMKTMSKDDLRKSLDVALLTIKN